MNICFDGHIEIVWSEGRYCPLCEAQQEIESLKQQVIDASN